MQDLLNAMTELRQKKQNKGALMIPKATAVEYRGRRERAELLGQRHPEAAWLSVSCGPLDSGSPGTDGTAR
jgi:hypothetical protein